MDHKTQTKIYRLLARAFYLLGVVTLLAGLGLSLFAGPVSASGLDTRNTPLPDYQLNLSHIACVDGKVEIHFVLLNVPSGLTPGNLTYTYSDGSSTHTATIAPGPNTGNVWHYTDYRSPGYYNVTAASVTVGGVTVNLHNPYDKKGWYCMEPPVTTQEPPATTEEPPVTTQEPPVTTEEPPVTTETPIIPPTGDQPTATPDPGGQPTPIPTFAPPPPSTSDQTPLLIPVTGADQTPRLPQAAPFLSFLGITFLGLGFVSHGLARRLEHERES